MTGWGPPSEERDRQLAETRDGWGRILDRMKAQKVEHLRVPANTGVAVGVMPARVRYRKILEGDPSWLEDVRHFELPLIEIVQRLAAAYPDDPSCSSIDGMLDWLDALSRWMPMYEWADEEIRRSMNAGVTPTRDQIVFRLGLREARGG